jgi:hypothetical protein
MTAAGCLGLIRPQSLRLCQAPALNLGHHDDAVVGRVEAWFEELWARSRWFDLGGLFERLRADYSPT